ncbi:MAG TPA: hypothetical protein VMU66_06465 [Gaiellales bacterium]|nr:hypothetical protein [Gaiellales bacterium]
MILVTPPPAQVSAVAAAVAPAAARLSALGLLRRADLGSGWALSLVAPRHAPPFACRARTKAASASATWSQGGGAVFASGTSYGFIGASAARRAWAQTGASAMRRCLKQTLAAGSTRRVRLTATAVTVLGPPRLPGAAKVRRYRVSGTATGAGQQVPVSLDVVLLGSGTWIAQDEFSALVATPPAATEVRAARSQIRRFVAR